MSKWRDTYLKQATGKTWKELTHRPTAPQIIKQITEANASHFDLRPFGWSEVDGQMTLSEEARQAHIHILGTTREGKSKFLEMLLTQDMGKFGATLLDPSDNGATCYSVLRWAMKQGFEKVCLIDPHDCNFLVPTINPLRFKGAVATDSVVANLMESIRLLWGQTSFADTPRIETYLTAVLTVLYRAQATIPDAVCFLVKQNRHSAYQRDKLLEHLPHYDESRLVLEEVFNTTGQQLFLGEFKPSIRRLSPFFKYLPRLIYGSTEHPIDFRKLISDKWLILVNLYKGRLWGTAQQRILGTLVVNEIVSAVTDLTHHGWQGQHYLYIDEAGQFATRVLADIMAYHGKSGLWATLSHQFYNQFEDKYVLDAVENLCHIKVLFACLNAQDRARMIRDMYTGDLKAEAADAHAALKKQHAVIKIGKQPPVTFKVQDINTPQYSGQEIGKWKEEKIYKPNPWYRTQAAIQEEIQKRFAIHTHPQSAASQPVQSKRRRNDKLQAATGADNASQPDGRQDSPSPEGSSVFDHIADSADVLQQKKGRAGSKRDNPSPQGR